MNPEFIITVTRKQLLELGLSEAAVNRLQLLTGKSNEPPQAATGVSSADQANRIEKNPMEVSINDLLVRPFEKILEDCLKSRNSNFKVTALFFSERPSGFILRKNRLITSAYAQNFTHSTNFESFFNKYNASGQSILSNLKYLRLCELHLNEKNKAAFVHTLNSFC